MKYHSLCTTPCPAAFQSRATIGSNGSYFGDDGESILQQSRLKDVTDDLVCHALLEDVGYSNRYSEVLDHGIGINYPQKDLCYKLWDVGEACLGIL
jgi:hypothetical protein